MVVSFAPNTTKLDENTYDTIPPASFQEDIIHHPFAAQSPSSSSREMAEMTSLRERIQYLEAALAAAEKLQRLSPQSEQHTENEEEPRLGQGQPAQLQGHQRLPMGSARPALQPLRLQPPLPSIISQPISISSIPRQQQEQPVATDVMVLDRSAPPQQQWEALSAELGRLKNEGHDFQDQKGAYFQQTCLAQTQLIQRQERELTALREDMARLKEKCEKRVKREKAKVTKREAEVSMEIFELKEQVARLTDANMLLQRELDSAHAHMEELSRVHRESKLRGFSQVDSGDLSGTDKTKTASGLRGEIHDHEATNRNELNLSDNNSNDAEEEGEEEDGPGKGRLQRGMGSTMLVLELSTKIAELQEELEAANDTIERLRTHQVVHAE